MPKDTLVDRVSRVAARVRELHPKLGTRSYRVFLVRRSWSGGERGSGSPSVISAKEILPAPHVMLNKSSRFSMHGTADMGTIRVGEITLHAYTEAELRGNPVDKDGQRFSDKDEFFWEFRPINGEEPFRAVILRVEAIRDEVQWVVTLQAIGPSRYEVDAVDKAVF